MNKTHFSSITGDVNSRHVECVCIANGVPLKDLVVSMQPVIRTFFAMECNVGWSAARERKDQLETDK